MTFLSHAVSEVIAGDLNGGMDLLVLQITFGESKEQQKKECDLLTLRLNFQNQLTNSCKYIHIRAERWSCIQIQHVWTN